MSRVQPHTSLYHSSVHLAKLDAFRCSTDPAGLVTNEACSVSSKVMLICGKRAVIPTSVLSFIAPVLTRTVGQDGKCAAPSEAKRSGCAAGGDP